MFLLSTIAISKFHRPDITKGIETSRIHQACIPTTFHRPDITKGIETHIQRFCCRLQIWRQNKESISMNLIQSLHPVNRADDMKWQELVCEINMNIPPLFWYGGAALDRKPIAALLNGSFPENAKKLLSTDVFPVLTDYNSKIVEAIKFIYENFDKKDFSFNTLPGDNRIASELSGMEILQMIPLTLFDSSALARIRKEYRGFHSSATSSVIPDDQWHFVFINAELDGRECSFAYGLIENLTFWKEVVEVYALNIEAFCALRVGGKSGSWDKTHSPKTGKLFNSIHKSNSKKPKLWVADDCVELRNIWPEINPHEDGFYGQMHFFETTWNMQ